jgi:hypothetical protein
MDRFPTYGVKKMALLTTDGVFQRTLFMCLIREQFFKQTTTLAGFDHTTPFLENTTKAQKSER